MLTFLGRGCGFSDEHNCGVFWNGSDFVMLDCSMTAFIKLKYFWEKDNLQERISRIVIAVTHTHSDHISGISMLMFYAFYVWKIPVLVIAPSEEVAGDLKTIIQLEGCILDSEDYLILSVTECRQKFPDHIKWLKRAIVTLHSAELDGKCFGYELIIGDEHILYTGDSKSLKSFMEYLTPGTLLYTECAYYRSPAHTHVDELVKLAGWFQKNGIKVFLMHLDEEEKLLEITNPVGFRFACLAEKL